ncbi:MAG: hypothetical protein IJ493_13810 [Clostridia bacterium]|nr:hypothetical protein [Clostridia bacterium]
MSKAFFALIKEKKIVIPTVCVLLVLAALSFVPIRWSISQTVTARVIENMSVASAVETELTIDGEYSFYLFRPDRFKGSIEMAAFPETAGKCVELETAEAWPDHLVYRSWNGAKLNSESFGLIQTDFGMKRMIIFKSDADGIINLSGEQTCVILVGDVMLSDAYRLLCDLNNIK